MASPSKTTKGAGATTNTSNEISEVPDRMGWLYKHSTGRSIFGRRNWQCRYVVSNIEGIAYFDREPFEVPKGFIAWDTVTHVYSAVNSAIDPAADDPDMSYFGIRFTDNGSSHGVTERILLFRSESSEERAEWAKQMHAMRAEAENIASMLDDDDDAAGPSSKAARRQPRQRGRLLDSVQTKLRTLVSLKKQRFVKDGIDLDLAYIGPRIIAMGFPSTGSEAVFRNPLPEVIDFFDRYHRNHFRVYNLCSERAYPPSRFDGHFERFPFDDHNAPPLSLIPPFIESAMSFLALDPNNVVAIHCKAGKGRTGLFACALLMALGTCTDSQAALQFFAEKRTKDGKGVQIPSQKRYLTYYEKLVKTLGGKLPAPVLVRLDSITLSSTPRFDPDGGCDPFLVIYRRRPDHQHVPLGTSEALVSKPMEVIYDSLKTTGPPKHVLNQKNVTITLKECAIAGEVRLELMDQDTLSKDDVMLSFWVHTAFLPQTGELVLAKHEIEEACKDKKHEYFDADFTLTLRYTVVGARGRA